MNGIGIDALTFYVPAYHMPLEEIARARGLKPERYRLDLGQVSMAVCPPCEDPVTMGVNAALNLMPLIEQPEKITWILFATETGVDQSKAAGLYVQYFLKLSSHCRILELKQACYSATGALQLAKALVHQNPDTQVLVITSDIARYALGSVAEPTQGCGAVAMLVKKDPKIAVIEDISGCYSHHVMDFWRPNYLEHAIVSHSYSVKNYFEVLEKCWTEYQRQSGLSLSDFAAFCYHTPFIRMAQRVHHRFCKMETEQGEDISLEETNTGMQPALMYNAHIGNAYTASLYISLCSLLEHRSDLNDQRIGLFSYGSGCVAEYFSLRAVAGYHKRMGALRHGAMLGQRHTVTYEQYLEWVNYPYPKDDSAFDLPQESTSGKVYLKGFAGHQRLYGQRV